jgi:hypothetical protein
VTHVFFGSFLEDTFLCNAYWVRLRKEKSCDV